MKKVLNNIGAISKQVIVGGAIGVATLMVGIGLMNNFSSNGDSEGGFASNALERSGYSYDSSYSGASADEILSARNYAQGAAREGAVSSITGADRLALSRKGGAQNTNVATSGTATANYENGAVGDNSSGYGAGEIEGMGTSVNVNARVSEEGEAAAKAKAQRDAKIAKGQALGTQARATLKTSKMADGSGIKGIETGSTSMSYGALSSAYGNVNGALDSSKVALANAKVNNTDLKNNSGKITSMGSNSVEAEGQRTGRASVGQNYEVLGDLGRASKYSRSGKNAVSYDAAKGAADAAAAFDGSKEAEVANLEGANLQQAARKALEDMGGPDMADLSKIREDLEEIDENMDEWSKLMDQYAMCIQSMILIASVAAIGIAVARQFGWVGLAGIAAIFFVALGGMLAASIASNGILGKVANLAQQTGYTEAPKGWDWAAPWVCMAGLTGALALAILGTGTSSSLLTKLVIGLITSLGGTGLTSSISNMISRGKKIRASKEAEKAAEEIKNKTNEVSNGY